MLLVKLGDFAWFHFDAIDVPRLLLSRLCQRRIGHAARSVEGHLPGFLELFRAHITDHSDNDEDDEEDSHENNCCRRVRLFLVWVRRLAVDLRVGVAVVQADLEGVELVVQANEEIAQEDGAEAVFAEGVGDTLDTKQAEVLPVIHWVKVALWLDHEQGITQFELQIPVFIIQVIAMRRRLQPRILALLLDPLNVSVERLELITECDELGHGDADHWVRGVDVSDLGSHVHAQVDGGVFEVIEHDTPIVFSNIWVPVKAVRSALDVTVVEVAESDGGDLISINRVLKIQSDFNGIDLFILVQANRVAQPFHSVLRAEADEALHVVVAIHGVNG